MKIFIKGKGETSLDNNDFIAQGGEGSVYAKGKTAYKIYADPSNMIPLNKIHELSSLTHANIIKPEDIILDSKSKPLGYTMKYVKNTYSLCQLFPKVFKQRNNLSPQMILDLVKKLQDIVTHVHDKKILIVDLNEMNFLCSNDFKDIYAIDVDSYQTPSYHATALMDSVRDRHAKPNHFDAGTDWFAFGMVSFNMFIGIHPYKGKHPTIKDMDDRMLKNISVLNKDVSVPGACSDFSVIPPNYMQWYKAILEEGKRIGPPSANDVIQVINKIKNIIGTNNFDIKELFDLHGDIQFYVNSYGHDAFITDKGIVINKHPSNYQVNGKVVLAFTEKMNHALAVTTTDDKLKITDLTTMKEYSLICDIDDFTVYQNRVLCKSGTNILEVELIEAGATIIPGFKVIGTVMPATNLFQGVAIQNMMDCYYVSLFPQPKTCYQVKTPELNGYRIVDAKFENKVLMVVATKHGKYDKFIFRYSNDFASYDLRIKKDINHSGFNFVVLDNGICVHINDEENLEIFSNGKDSTSLKVVDDPAIKDSMKLYKILGGVGFAVDNKLYSMKMK